MPPELQTFIPDADVLLALEPQELAGIVLKFLKAQGGDTQNRAENEKVFLLTALVNRQGGNSSLG